MIACSLQCLAVTFISATCLHVHARSLPSCAIATACMWLVTTVHKTYLRMILLRSFATILLHSGQAEVASATAADVSFAFMQGTVAITSPVAGFLTCSKVTPSHAFAVLATGTTQHASNDCQLMGEEQV